ncbi:MAG: hypothetical protein R3D67_22440, partial [Hyphomicrobiaceae bacterium]
VVLACAVQSAIFGLLLAGLVPMIVKRLGGVDLGGLARRAGVGLVGGGLFGLVHLVTVCAADGFPPRIIQSTGVALIIVGVLGAMLLLSGSKRHQVLG